MNAYPLGGARPGVDFGLPKPRTPVISPLGFALPGLDFPPGAPILRAGEMKP